MAKEAKKTAAAAPEYAGAMDKLRDEMAKEKSEQIQLLGEGLTAMLQLHPEWADALQNDKTSIKGALDAVRRNAKGGCSDPIQTTKSLCGYYGIKCADPRGLALEVAATLADGSAGDGVTKGSGGTTYSPAVTTPLPPDPVDPFDLDILLMQTGRGGES